jgi:hypothetical protein
MKTSSKCLDCYRKARAEYMRKFNSNPDNREKKNNRDKKRYNENKKEIREKINTEYHTNPEKRKKKQEQDKKYNEKVKADPVKLEKKRESGRKSTNKIRNTPDGLEKSRAQCRKYGKNNRDKINSRRKERRKNNEQERLADNLRHAVRRVIKSAGIQKTWKGEITKELTSSILLKIGPRPDDTYHLDHIIPISLFDLTKKEHRDLANSPDNLRWLPGKENLEKSDSIVLEIIKSSQELINIAKQINLI